MHSVTSCFSENRRKILEALDLMCLRSFSFFNIHRCSGGFLARQHLLYYSQQLLSMEIKSIYLVSKPAIVVRMRNLDPCVSPGWRYNSFSSLNECCLYCHCNADEHVRRLCSV